MPDKENGPGRDLDRELRDLGHHTQFPPTPDLARAVRQRLDEQERQPRVGWWSSPAVRWSAAAALVLLFAIPVLWPMLRDSTQGSPGANQQAAEGGGAARESDRAAEPAAPSSGAEGQASEDALPRERPVLEQGSEAGSAGEQVPLIPELGNPDETGSDGEDGVSAVYRPRPSLPPLGDTGIGLILTRKPGTVRSAYLDGESTSELRRVDLDGQPSLWVPDGQPLPGGNPALPSANVLLWESGGDAYRLEADVPEQEAIRLASSMR